MDAVSNTFRKLAVRRFPLATPPRDGSPPNNYHNPYGHSTHLPHTPPHEYTQPHNGHHDHTTPYHVDHMLQALKPLTGSRLRILCLHGYGGSASTLASQIGSLSSILAPYADLVFVDAPSIKEGDYGWWHARFHRYDGQVVYEGWERTRQGLIEKFAKDGPFDGILGFSQGAILTGVLCGLNAGPNGKTSKDTPFRFGFAIMVGGFTARDDDLSKLFDRHELYTIPSLHVYGVRDGVVSPESSQALAEMFKRPTIITHSGGHVIPSVAEAKKQWEGFFKTQYERRNRQQVNGHARTITSAHTPPIHSRTASEAYTHQLPAAHSYTPSHEHEPHDVRDHSHTPAHQQDRSEAQYSNHIQHDRHTAHVETHAPLQDHLRHSISEREAHSTAQPALHTHVSPPHKHNNDIEPAQAHNPHQNRHHLTQAPLTMTKRLSSTTTRAPLELRLWPSGSQPRMTVYFPSNSGSNSNPHRLIPAMIVFRGGAYSTALGSGAGAAQWAASRGFLGVEVEYGTAAMHRYWPDNFSDGARAIRLVRSKAGEWGVDPGKIGVMGFSAGGHLAATLATQPDLFKDGEDDLVEKFSARPDLVVLAYGVLSFVDGYYPGAYVSSVGNFFGTESVSEERRRKLSSELHVTPATPPAFVWTMKDDYLVPPVQSLRFAEACEKVGVEVDFKVYEQGRHGIGLALGMGLDVSDWTERLLVWLGKMWGEEVV